jgi:hypothetical protein
MKMLVTALSLGTLFAVAAFIACANAQAMGPARERAIRECNALQRSDSHDPYDRQAGVMYRYYACMAERGQMG